MAYYYRKQQDFKVRLLSLVISQWITTTENNKTSRFDSYILLQVNSLLQETTILQGWTLMSCYKSMAYYYRKQHDFKVGPLYLVISQWLTTKLSDQEGGECAVLLNQ